MSFIACVNEKVNAGILSKKQLQSLEKKFEETKQRYMRSMGDEQAATQAARKVIDLEKTIIADKKRNQIRSAVVQDRLRKVLSEAASERGVKFDTAVNDLLQMVHAKRGKILGDFLQGLDEFANKHKTKFAGLTRNDEGLIDVMMELLGKKTDNAEAAEFAVVLRKSLDVSHARYKNAGGIIGRLDNYTPQVDNATLIKEATFDEWYNFKRDLLDVDRMIDVETGLPISEEKLLAVMKQDYETIVTDGRSQVQNAVNTEGDHFGFGVEVSQTRMSSRFYHFKDADSFKLYNDKYGSGDRGLFDAIFNQLEAYARDTAILEELGPLPNSTMRMLDKEMGERGVGPNKRKLSRGMYNVLTGFIDSSVGHNLVTRTVANLQNIFSAAYLGSAPVSAMGDVTFMAAAANQSGLKATKVIQQYGKLINPANGEHRRIAEKAGYIADTIRGSILSEVRFTGENMGGPVTSWLSQFTNRASGLHAMTKAAGDAPVMVMHMELADLMKAGTKWEGIEQGLKEALEAHDISKSDWELMSKAELWAAREDMPWLRPEEIAAVKDIKEGDLIRARAEVEFEMRQKVIDDLRTKEGDLTISEFDIDEELKKRLKTESLDDRVNKRADANAFKRSMEVSDKLGVMLQNLRDLATNEPRLMTQTITKGAFLGDARGGTLLRMVASSVSQFKSFSITVLLNHIMPVFRGNRSLTMRGSLSGKQRARQLAWVSAGASMMGAVALQMEQIVKGKDFHDMSAENWRFWGASYAKSGGLGLFGDYLFKDYSRFGRDPLTESLGPTIGFMSDFMRTFKGSLDKSLEDDSGKAWDAFKRNTFQLVRRNIPAQNLWYSRLALERLVFDQMESMIDPKFEQRVQRMENKMMKESGQEYFWGRGETSPDRAPEVSERPDR